MSFEFYIFVRGNRRRREVIWVGFFLKGRGRGFSGFFEVFRFESV